MHGWVEQWIECVGAVFDRARSAGLLRPERPILHVGFPHELLQAFDRCHALAQQRSIGIQSLLSTIGLHLLAILLRAARGHPARRDSSNIRFKRLKEFWRVVIMKSSAWRNWHTS